MFYQNISELIGNTPLVKIQRMNPNPNINLLAKIEYFNPASSVKDRLAAALIADAEKKGLIQKDTIIVEPTSGNTGIGLALICAVKGYQLLLIMPETMSIERRKLMLAYGAKFILTPGPEGMKGAVKKTTELINSSDKYLTLGQFDNPTNPEIHRQTTANEIWADTKGKIDVLVAGVGTGGTLTGVAEVLKQKNPDLQVVAVEPHDSPVLSGGSASPHKIQGIGAGFIPKVLNRNIIDEIIAVKNEDAKETARILAKREGLLVGISSGAAMFAALEICQRPSAKTQNIVTIFPDNGERYLSTWLFEDLT